MNKDEYTKINSEVIDKWCRDGWIWNKPISHDCFEKAKTGDWDMLLTPTKPVPKSWFCDMSGAKILGLASGGGQQMPIFAALGACCTVLDFSQEQLNNEKQLSEQEGYNIKLVHADMTKPLPFEDDEFDLIFNPVSNCYVEHVEPIWRECFRVLKKGGILLAGLDNGINFVFNEDETEFEDRLPFNPLKNKKQYEYSIENDFGIQFSHTIEEQIGGQLDAGFMLTGIYEDTNEAGRLKDFGVPAFFATRAIKP